MTEDRRTDPIAPIDGWETATSPATDPPEAPASPAASRRVSLPASVGARATIARSFDLALHASGQLRPASIYIGVQVMALLGPLIILGILAFTRLPEISTLFSGVPATGGTLSEADGGLFALIAIGLLIGGIGVIALSLDSQLIAAALLAGRLVGRPLTLREAVVRARQSFWKVFWASVIVGIPLAAVAFVLTELFAPVLGRNTEGTTLAVGAVGTIAALPFVYIVAGVVLGEVASAEAIRRSIRLARARWRLALVVSLFGAAVGYVQIFALGAGGDVLVRVATALGLGFEAGAGSTFVTLCLLLAGLLALGSLLFTVAALTIAPQVVAFHALAGYAGGLDRAREVAAEPSPAAAEPPAAAAELPAAAPTSSTGADAMGPAGSLSGWAAPPVERHHFRWVSVPMVLGIAISVLTSIAGIANVVGRA